MEGQILYCKKYQTLLNEKKIREKNCLCKFKHNGQCGICPNVIDLLTNRPLYKILFSKKASDNGSDRETEDYWTKKNREYFQMITKMRQLDPSRDIFK